MKPLVSVMMLTYNHEPYIARAIEGVVSQQTDFPFELVIGEDCSTDNTRAIVMDYRDKYPDIVKASLPPVNLGAAENARCIDALCTGTYIAWCEGDDYWHDPRKLQLQVQHMQNNPRCPLVCSDYDICWPEHGIRVASYVARRGWQVPTSGDIAHFISGRGGPDGRAIVGNAILTCTALAKRSLVTDIIAADPYLHGDNFPMSDTQLWAELSGRGPVGYIDLSTATHNILDESASRSRDRCRTLRFQISNAELYMYLADKYDLPEIRATHQAHRARLMLRLAFESGDPGVAREAARQKRQLTLKERLWAVGASRRSIFRIFRAYDKLRTAAGIHHDEWLEGVEQYAASQHHNPTL